MVGAILVGSFLLGLSVGSFLNVVIFRLGKERFTGRSHCPHCGRALAWHELLPLASFFLQRGRCRSCNEKLSLQYPLVEGLTGVLFLLVSARFLLWFPGGLATNFLLSRAGWWVWVLIVLWWYFAATLLAIAVYDARHYLIPDMLLGPAAIVALLASFFKLLPSRLSGAFFPPDGISFLGSSAVLFGRSAWLFLGDALVAVIIAVVFLGGIYVVSRGRAMGFGDVKMGAFLGLALPWPDIVLTLFLSFLAGTLVSTALIVLRKKGVKSAIPFGPFLSFGALTTMLFGDRIIGAYLNFFPTLFL